MKISDLAWNNFESILEELFGEKTDHPLLARILAFLIDYFIFFIAVFIYVGLYFLEIELETLTRLIIDLSACTLYFSFGSSKVFKGQTIGKKLLRIRVVDNEGKYLSLARSFIRSLPIVLAINSYEIMYYVVKENEGLYILAFYELTAILFSIIYFPLLQLDRRGPHDLIVYSQVIPRDRTIKIENRINWSLIIVFVAIVTLYVFLMLSNV